MNFLKIVSYLGLALTLLPCLFLAGDVIDSDTSKMIMTIGMFVWFGTAVFWIKPSSFEEEDS